MEIRVGVVLFAHVRLLLLAATMNDERGVGYAVLHLLLHLDLQRRLGLC